MQLSSRWRGRRTQFLEEEGLESISASHKEVSLRYETKVDNVRQQADTLVCELEKEIQQRKVLHKDYDELQEAHSLNQDRFIAKL